MQDWQQKHSELKDFIAIHPEVIIEPNRVRIPDSIRPDFYRLFDALRLAFIQKKTPAILKESKALSQAYIQVENEVIKLLELDEVSMMPGLDRFLHDPADQLRRGLCDPLFDWLKDKIDANMFEVTAAHNISNDFSLMYMLGYEKWVSMSLMKLLKADELLHVILPELSLYDAHKSGGTIKEEVPDPEKARSIAFEFAPNVSCNVADWIIRSPKTGRYVSSRSQFGEPFSMTDNASEKREWFPRGSVPPLEAGLLLLCQGDNSYDISLFSDARRVCRPDIVLVCKPLQGWYEKEGLEKVKAYHQGLKPLLGTFVVCMGEVPELKPEEQMEGIHILTVGFDQSRLEPIIKALINKG